MKSVEHFLHLRKVLFSTLVIICFNLISCNSGKENLTTEILSGEELFRGIYYGEGKVADKLPEVKNILAFGEYLEVPEQIHIIKEVQEDVFNQIKKNEPNFFNEFGEKIQSGDHFQIKSALISANTKIAVATAQVANISEDELDKIVESIVKKYPHLVSGELMDREEIKNMVNELYKVQNKTQVSDPSLRPACLAGPVVVAIALAGTAVLVVNVAAVLNAVWWSVDVKTWNRSARLGFSNSSLFAEKLVNSIAENFKK